ncbi:MFS transporter [Haloquadratum walsbyi]|jgi:NNP family nitrate/nitrite transporter-like MFS transporter|uniref:MFS transporter n=1 Tax=Haloquadratum walsbyi TaxID=293091 RepID=UPI0015F36CC5|nr:MFS transporter [Haloquadratum walsbyi]
MEVFESTEKTSIIFWRVVTIATGWLVLLFVGSYLITPASILTVVMNDLDITEATAAALVSMPQVTATVVGIPVGLYLDRVQTRGVVPAAAVVLLIGSVGDWFAGGAGNISLLIASRLFAGAGMFVLWVVCINVASSTVPPTRRATATSVIISGYPAGYALGQFSAPRVAEIVGWPGVFPLFGAAVLVSSVVFYFAVGNVTRFETPAESPTFAEFRQVFVNRNIWSIVIVTVLAYSLYMVFNSWMPTYIIQQYDISLAESGTFVALFPAVGIIARPVGGWVSDVVLNQRRRPIFAASFVGAIVVTVALFYTIRVTILVMMLILAGVVIQLQIGLLYQSAQEFVDPKAAGTAVSIASVAGWLGSFVAPVIAGELVAITGSYVIILWFAGSLGVAGGFSVWRMSESGIDMAPS